jgi:RNA polymerase sigma-70 factor (ECF subfamily)
MSLGSEDFAGRRMEQTRSGPDGDFVRSALRQFERPLVGYATHLLGGDAEQARDVVQEAFFRLCAEPRERVEPHLREWLYAVCRNLAIDIRRKERRMQPMSEAQVQNYSSSDEGPTEPLEREDTLGQVAEALQGLSANQQEVVRLKFQHGMSYKQISQVTKLSVTNVGFLLHTALKTIRQRLGDATVDSTEEKKVSHRWGTDEPG